MNFYVTLPSNGAELKTESDKITNTQSDFFINFNRTMDLKDYEVALVEVSFKAHWLVDIGTFHLTNWTNIPEKKVSFTISRLEGVDMIDALEHNLKEMNNFFQKEFGERANKITFDVNKQKKFFELTIPLGFKLDISGNLVDLIEDVNGINGITTKAHETDLHILNKKHAYTIDNEIHLLGVDDVTIQIKIKNLEKKIINELFLYSNIIDYQFVGSEMVQMLRIISVNKVPPNKLIDIIYDSPHYVRVLNNKIHTIRMFLRDSNGEPIRFVDTNSKVIYKLHFRQIKN